VQMEAVVAAEQDLLLDLAGLVQMVAIPEI
jgi:hypothetical protein